jgi:hypothetical protein
MRLTILYTANLLGDIETLPRLYTFLRQLKQEAVGRVLLLDAGDACAAGVWHCDITGGRSALLVLDAMGYHAANATDYLTAAGRVKLAENILNIAVLTAGDVWEQDGIVVTSGDLPEQTSILHIALTTADETKLDQQTLHLASVNAGEVGVIDIGPANGNGRLTIHNSALHTLPASTLPDPTIAATVDFVLGEARYYQRRRGDL